MDVLAAADALLTLLAAGLDGLEAAEEPGVGRKELGVLQALLGAAPRGRPPREARLAERHLQLVVAAFGEAWRRHWGGSEALAPPDADRRLRDRFDRPARARREDLAARLELARVAPLRPGEAAGAAELEAAEALAGSPLATPAFRRLWLAFTDPTLDEEGAPPFVVFESPGEAFRFQQHVLLAWHEALARPAGHDVAAWLASLGDHKARVLQELVLTDMARWADRDPFDRDGASGPAVPAGAAVGALYEEPLLRLARPLPEGGRARVRGADPASPPAPDLHLAEPPWPSAPRAAHLPDLGPALALLDPEDEGALTRRYRLVVVTAPYGQGKTLTARLLACRLAERWLSGARPAPDLWLPIYVHAPDAIPADGDGDPARVVRRALDAHARALGLDLGAGDPACAPPGPDQPTLFLLDGLDEAPLDARGLRALLDRLEAEAASARHRYVAFVRPAVVAEAGLPAEVPVVSVAPFDRARVGRWLARWHAATGLAAPTLEDLEARRLLALAGNPLLLHLLAHAWGRLGPGEEVRRTALYRSFLARMALGRLEPARRAHRRAEEALRALERLVGVHDTLGHGPDDAMLRLMAALAWRTYRRHAAEAPPTLDARDLDEEVELLVGPGADEATRELVRTAALLALQADLGGPAHEILLGHRAFLEFLVALWWETRLRACPGPEAGDAERLAWEASLEGADLLAREDDQVVELLVELVRAWPERLRLGLVDAALAIYRDERLSRPAALGGSARDDQRTPLRRVALALACALAPPGRVVTGEAELRSLVAYYVAHGAPGRVVAPGLVLRGLRLAGLDMRASDLSGADARGADLRAARLGRSRLVGLRAGRADLRGARLGRCDLDGADLCCADLSGASLGLASLRGADLSGAEASGAYLGLADLRGADLTNAELRGASLARADLTGADLGGARLVRADLAGACLAGARFDRADLRGADLRLAVFDADEYLRDAPSRALPAAGQLAGALWDADTRWPEGFAPPVAP